MVKNTALFTFVILFIICSYAGVQGSYPLKQSARNQTSGIVVERSGELLTVEIMEVIPFFNSIQTHRNVSPLQLWLITFGTIKPSLFPKESALKCCMPGGKILIIDSILLTEG